MEVEPARAQPLLGIAPVRRVPARGATLVVEHVEVNAAHTHVLSAVGVSADPCWHIDAHDPQGVGHDRDAVGAVAPAPHEVGIGAEGAVADARGKGAAIHQIEFQPFERSAVVLPLPADTHGKQLHGPQRFGAIPARGIKPEPGPRKDERIGPYHRYGIAQRLAHPHRARIE